jgi:hypothetical protein
MTQGNNQLARTAHIEDRIDKTVAGGIGMSPMRGMVVDSMSQAMEVAKLMAVSGCAVPGHLRNNPGACLAVAIQGYEWSVNPFAIANKSYVVNDRLAYESAIYHAVVQRRAPIEGRVKLSYGGKGLTRTCKVWAKLSDGTGETVEYESPEIQNIRPQNSPLWKNDPDQQLFYFSVRAFARRHFPDVMMGIYTVDELQDNPAVPVVTMTPGASRTEELRNRLTARPVSEGQTLEPDKDAVEALAAQQASEQPQGPSPAAPSASSPEPAQPSSEGGTVPEPAGQAEGTLPGTATSKPEPVRVPDLPATSPILLDHGKWWGVMESAAQSLGMSPEDLNDWAAKNCPEVANPIKQAKMTPATRRKHLHEFVKAAGGIIQ